MMIFLCRIQSVVLIGFLFFISNTSGQCPIADFTISSPVCGGSPLNITNNSSGASRYEWDFAPGYFSQPPVKSSDSVLTLVYPADLTSITENDTLITFICGNADGKLYRVIYGNGPENPLTQFENLGNLGGALYQPSDIALFQENSEWFGIIVDYGSNSLIRCHFGNSLRNTPDSISVLLNNTNSNLNSPWSVKVVKDDNGIVHAIATNFTSGTITHFNFGASIRNAPAVSTPIAVTGTTYVLDAYLAHDCGNWYAFIAGYNSSNIIRADFGSSLDSTPSFQTIISNGSPSDIVLINDSSHWKLLYTNYIQNNVMRYDLGSSLSGGTPVLLGTDIFGGGNPKGITSIRKDANDFVSVLYNSTNNLQVLNFSNSTVANIYSDTSFAPGNIFLSNGGTYPVSLKAFDNAGNFSSKTINVTVSTVPVSNFTFQNKCLGDMTAFSDSSVIINDTINTWKWDFGDGDSSALQNPVHLFSVTGNYNVSLVTVSNSGCSDTIIKTVDITDFPAVSFASPSAVCSQTALQFTDQSNVVSGTITSWLWHFGNGDTSTVQNPLYSFPGGGNYNVGLTVTTAAGCSDSSSSTLSVNDRPTAGFSISNTCIGQFVVFTDHTIINNSSINNYDWDFGDGNTDTVATTSHLYAAAVATYPAQLIVTAVNGCKDTASQNIKINNIPTVSFSYNPASVCQNNDVAFTDLSTVTGDTISGWSWDFGDSTAASVANPLHRFSTPGIHTVSLIAYSPSSCPGIVYQQNVTVLESPAADFIYSTTCLGNSTHFTNNSIPAAGSTIDSVLWIFNNTDSSTIYSPDYIFASTGSFPVTLTVTSSDGCKSTDSLPAEIHPRPLSVFTHSIPCTGDSVHFSNASTCDSLSSLSQYDWNFGDISSGINNSSSSQNPSHKFNTPQVFNVSLITTTNFGCKDTTTETMTINQSPASQFTYSPTCLGNLTEFFNPGSPLDSAYQWDFGDNQTNLLKEPAHFYAFTGTYTVTLNVISRSGCSTLASKQVSVSPIPVADFISSPACINTGYQFHDNSSITAGSIDLWKWNIAGLPEPDSVQNPYYIFSDSGAYNVTLTITSDIGCTKSVTKILGVHSLPVSSFSFDPQFGNPPLDVQTTDLSASGAYYLWDFGDGSAVVNLQDPSHQYTDTGLFIITEYVTSSFGCKDSLSKNIYVINPILDIAVTGDSSYFDGNYFHVVGRLENHGTREVNSLQMEARLENGNTIRETLTESIPNGPLGYLTYPFHASFLMSSGSDFRYYCIKALSPNGLQDNNPGNNERCFNLTDDIITMDPFPNPFTKNLTIRLLLPQQEELKIEMADMTGKTIRVIYDSKANKNLFEINTDLSDLPDGIYSVKFIYKDRIIGKNVVKNNHRQ